MSAVDIPAVAAAALGRLPDLLADWLPDGRREGHEWLARNPCRSDRKPGSFKINMTTGRWSDFATDAKGGDAVSLFAFLRGTSQIEAARAVADRLGLPLNHQRMSDREKIAKAPRPRPQLSGVLVPDWTPLDDDGHPLKLHFVGKPEPRDFGDELRRHRYMRDGEAVRCKIKKVDGGWVDWYRARRLEDGAVGWQARKPGTYIAVPYMPPGCRNPFDPERCGEDLAWAEGEKDADALHAAGFASFTFGSASDVPDVSDLLRDHAVLIVVDHDQAGRDSIPTKVGAAIAAGARSVRLVQFDGRRDGFDAADFFEAGGTAEDVLDLAERIDPATWDAEVAPPTSPDDPPAGRFADVRPQIRPLPTLVWFGDTPPEPPPMLVQDLLPQGQIAIAAGVFSAGKTFVAADLAACIMLDVPFAGHEIVRPGGVLWFAAEGANEIDARMRGAAEARSDGDAPALPFARQAFDVPKLTGPEAEAQIIAHADAFKAGLAQRFAGTDLVMIVIDTLGSAAAFLDANSSAEAQRVMDMLRRVNVATGALVLLVDHFGKAVETGVMGASAKAQSADAVLAILADKAIEGDISNRRMAVAKLRGGAGGAVTPFRLRQVPIGGSGGTTCVVDWETTAEANQAPAPRPEKPAWSPGGNLLKACMLRVAERRGERKRPFGGEGPEVTAVMVDDVRAEFIASHAAESHDAKKKQWQRMLKEATERQLVATRSLGDPSVDWAWLTTKGEGR